MRSTFSGLNTLVRGINANQLSQQTVGHNISNADVEGYSRQSVNLAATRGQFQTSVYGEVIVGTGVDSTSLTRARDIYADRQYWSENSTQEYYNSRAKEYDKLEAIFNDTTNEGVQSALEAFYKSWDTLSVYASDSSARISVLEHGKVLADRIHSTTRELQDQIEANYNDISLNVRKLNEMFDQVVELNKNIMSTESTGASANDLRDQRDLLVDNISGFVNVNVYENSDGMISLVSNGVSLVNGINHLTLEMSTPIENADYGINDYTVLIKEAQISYQPTSGSLKAVMDAIVEDKSYIDDLANMSAFLLSDLNEQHQQGHGIDTAETAGINFFGDANTQYQWDTNNQQLIRTKYTDTLDVVGYTYAVAQNQNYQPGDPNYNYVKATLNAASGTVATDPTTGAPIQNVAMHKVDIINALSINTQLTAPNGQLLVAASGYGYTLDANGNPDAIVANDEGDGANAVMAATLFNMDMKKSPKYDATQTAAWNEAQRAIGTISLNAYYNKSMTQLGSNAEAMDTKVKAQEEIMTQITEWRESTSGVNWNEELTNMIMFQQGFSACSRCLTTMDEMLDRLINSTGMVGR